MAPKLNSSLGLMAALALLLAGCAQLRSPESSVEGTAESVYYAGTASLTVHAEASSASKVVGHLALHEKVTRSRVEHGYAHVLASESGVEGWVDNAQLIWRLPPDPVSDPAPAVQPEATTVVPIPTVPDPAPEPAPDPAPPAPVSAPADAPPAEKPPTPPPAVFDPF
jgi:hypothetical protein